MRQKIYIEIRDTFKEKMAWKEVVIRGYGNDKMFYAKSDEEIISLLNNYLSNELNDVGELRLCINEIAERLKVK